MKDSKLKEEVQAAVREYLRVRVSLYVKSLLFCVGGAEEDEGQ